MATKKTSDQVYLKKLRKVQIEIMDYVFDFCKKHDLKIMLYGGTCLGAIRHKGYIPWDDDVDLAMPRADYDKFIEIWKDTDKYQLDCCETNPDYWLPFLKIRNKKTKFIEGGIQEDYKGPTGIWVDIMPFDNGSADFDELDRIKYKKQLYTELIIRKSSIGIDFDGGIKNKVKDIIAKITPRKFLVKKLHDNCAQNKDENSPNLICYHNRRDVRERTWPRESVFPLKKAEFEGKKYPVPNDCKVFLSHIYGDDYMQLPPLEQRKTHHPACVEFEDGTSIDFSKEDSD